MITHLDKLLRELFKQIPGLDEAHVRFQPPDDDWRNYLATLAPGNALNVYLADLREHRKLRTNEKTSEVKNGIILETLAPYRLDCHYLISAWSSVGHTPALEPTLDEHELLQQVIGLLWNNEPLIPRQVYKNPPLPANFPAIAADAELPLCILPVEGFGKLAEFWSGMGPGARWKPVVYLIATIPIELFAVSESFMVTTKLVEYRQVDVPEPDVILIQIGGFVLDATVDPPKPIPDTWVQLEKPDGTAIRSTHTDQKGRFTFDNLQAGEYRLQWRAMGRLVMPPRKIQVPSESGEYDLRFE
jgi:hypothetical protein